MAIEVKEKQEVSESAREGMINPFVVNTVNHTYSLVPRPPACTYKYCRKGVYTISGLDWWTGPVDWTTGIKFDHMYDVATKIFSQIRGLSSQRGTVDTYGRVTASIGCWPGTESRQ